jgi:hypothetical protein
MEVAEFFVISFPAEPLAILPLSFVVFANMSLDPKIINTDGSINYRHMMIY